MDFRFDVADVLLDEITFIDSSLVVPGWRSTTNKRQEFNQLTEIINVIGESSSFAQGLNNVITTAEKLQNNPDQFLYLMKETDENSGRTVVVGMLKIGRKKLFVLDRERRTVETAPLCVLDFYVHESRQRRGYGRHLFDYMLKHQNILPGHLAIDKPSDKFLEFFKKHYGLSAKVPQVNNFVVYEEFFEERPISKEEATRTRSNRSTPRNLSPERQSQAQSRCAADCPDHTQYAGLPSRPTHMSEILQGGQTQQHHSSIRIANRHHTSLDWMRGDSPTREGIYSRTPASYSPSRTPSYSGTPRAMSPPRSNLPHATPAKDQVDNNVVKNGSIAPTPTVSPLTSSPRQAVDPPSDEFDHLSVADSAHSEDEDAKNLWRDSVSRSSVGLVEHMASPRGGTMKGVLGEGESVHGHLKFHHHALW